MKKINWQKILPLAAILAAVLFVAPTHFAHAGLLSSAFDDIGYYVIGKIAFGISYLIAWIAGIGIAIEAWLIGVMLGLNSGVFQADIVQKGFGVTLTVANLGFVLGIIIVAVATILHAETYGYKKMLWKLVAAAILVNFSLVIAAPIFGLSNSMTSYFLNCINPVNGGCNGQGVAISFTNGNNSMNQFAANLAGAFNPQVGLITSASTTTTVPDSVALGQDFGKMLIPIFSIGFVAFELVAIAIVLGALIMMLLIRYIWIAMLAILMPFAWLGWVFPGIKDWWTKWWHNFIRWTFFVPIVVFFLWLAMATMNSMRNGTAIASQQFGTYTSNSNPVWSAVSHFLSNAFIPIVGQSLNVILMIGLTVGGMMVADKMSITGAKAAMSAVQSVGKAAGGFATKQAKKTGRWAMQRSGINQRAAQLRQSNLGVVGRIPIVGGLARKATNVIGSGVEDISTNAKMVEDAKKDVPKDWKKIEADVNSGGLSKQRLFASLAELAKQGKLHANTMIGNERAADFFDKNENLFKRYGQEKLLKDGDKAFMGSKAYRDAVRMGDAVKSKEEMEKYIKGFDKKDSKSVNANDTFFAKGADGKPVLDANGEPVLTADGKDRLNVIASERPDLIPGIYSKLDSKNREKFQKEYPKIYEQEIEDWNKEVTQRETAEVKPLEDQLAVTKAERDQAEKDAAKARKKVSDLQQARTIATGTGQTQDKIDAIDRDIATNEADLAGIEKRINDSLAADKPINQQIKDIRKDIADKKPEKIAKLERARTAFERIVINNLTREPESEREGGDGGRHRERGDDGGHDNEGGGGGHH